ncbi:hypothetical protein B0H21DRAFT_748981 [Amylocystis lapponica]|nr:hypothetical protein B0H21DRAFT_748981 [Amylocystis lapponica]
MPGMNHDHPADLLGRARSATTRLLFLGYCPIGHGTTSECHRPTNRSSALLSIHFESYRVHECHVCSVMPTFLTHPFPTVTMHQTSRLLEAAAALSQLLRAREVPHAFHGNVLTAILSDAPQADEIFCIVEGGTSHPFRRVRLACAGSTDFSTVATPWGSRLHVTYHRPIPPIDIEILPAGEEGPRRLDATTVMMIGRVPFLTISEFIRAKLKAWALRGIENDAADIVFAISRYWDRVDINRIPEQEMNTFVRRYKGAASGWIELKRKYGMS